MEYEGYYTRWCYEVRYYLMATTKQLMLNFSPAVKYYISFKAAKYSTQFWHEMSLVFRFIKVILLTQIVLQTLSLLLKLKNSQY